MDNMTKNNNEEIEIDISRLFSAIWKKVWVVAIAAVLSAACAFAFTLFFIAPEYQAAAKFYVNNGSISVGGSSLSISSGDLVTSRNLVDSYIVILNTRESLNEVIDYAGVDLTYTEVKNMLSAEAVNETEIFKVAVTSKDPNEAEKIANAIAYILPKRISSIIEGTSAKVVEAAVVPVNPSSPSYTKNTLAGFLIGFALAVMVIILREIFDITICTEDDIARCCKHPVLAAVPDMASTSKGGYDYKYDSHKREGKKGGGNHGAKNPVLIGGGVSFAAAEAYKLLRTKLQFSFTDENNSRVIGISSAMSGEGKSLSAINLAYTLSQLNKKVILIDCDMRRPTLAEKLNIRKLPGLSSFLTGQSNLEGLIQYCGIREEENAFHVITAGQNPPNPIELLSSTKMIDVVNALRKVYDFIILDLPPVGEVSDALAITKQTDGVLLVVRQNYCDRQILGETVRQFEFVDGKILGVVFNCVNETSGKGYYKKYYKKYGKRYYEKAYSKKSKYEGSYLNMTK